MTTFLNRRLDLLLVVISILPAFLSGLNLSVAADFWITLIYFSPALTFLVTLAIVPRLGGVSSGHKAFSRVLSIVGLVSLVGVLTLPMDSLMIWVAGVAFLASYVLVAVWNLGYVVYRRVLGIP